MESRVLQEKGLSSGRAMSNWSSGVDHPASFRPRSGFFTPPANAFHVVHKVPFGDSPYVKAKHAQLIDKDPKKAIALFWGAINAGDRVDSALKDMAAVMKQLERSDEAIEAIRSFRHLCATESQDSLDNLLIDLYKQAGRIEEQIEILQFKVKRVEQDFALGGRRMKMGRSQGKRIQIPVEREYSRLLGNLAWAYMQQKDFESAEEQYRKALSFDFDKNKQCNLALCLMQENKLTEARFLLQAVRDSSSGCIEESHAKSYERASEMLAELESQQVLKPVNRSECNKDVPYQRRAEFDWRRNRAQLNDVGREVAHNARKRSYNSPLSHPKQCPWYFNKADQRNTRPTGSGHGGSCKKMSFGSSTVGENYSPKKSWADVIEEDIYSGFIDENVDHNIMTETPTSMDHIENLSQRIEWIDLEESGYRTQPEKPKNHNVRRSLSFEQDEQPIREYNWPNPPLLPEMFDFEVEGLELPEDLSSGTSINQTKRLPVFQDLTHAYK